jgi:hypothetical protein
MSERRGQRRIAEVANVEIVIDAAPGVPGLDGTVFPCRTADVSLRGVRLQVDRFLPVNAYVKLSVKFPRNPERFRHTGRVVWCRKAGEADGDRYYAGIEFRPGAAGEFDEWRFAILKLFEEGSD